METISVETFKIKVNNGLIFGVQFIKKNGEVRDMTARTHVSALIKEANTRLDKGVRKAEDERCGVLTVYDMAKVNGDDTRGAFRRISLDAIKFVTINKTKYAVV